MKTITAVTLAFCTATLALAQGTLVFDQQSSTDETYPIGGPRIQFYGTVGQSFIPSLSTVGFIRLKLDDVTHGNGIGATLYVNLRANAINGSILGTSTPVPLSDSFSGSVDFFFANAVPVNPGTTFYFQAVVQSGDNWGITTMSNTPGDNYPNGVFYGGLQPFSGGDLWFREGIIVPEPSLIALLGLGGLGVCWRRVRGRQ